jgi:hypothetical protein
MVRTFPVEAVHTITTYNKINELHAYICICGIVYGVSFVILRVREGISLFLITSYNVTTIRTLNAR